MTVRMLMEQREKILFALTLLYIYLLIFPPQFKTDIINC